MPSGDYVPYYAPFIQHLQQLWFLEQEEELNRNDKYIHWTINNMINNHVAIANLMFKSAKFVSHGLREVLFQVPLKPGTGVGSVKAQYVCVRDTLRLQDFVTIRRRETPLSDMYTQVSHCLCVCVTLCSSCSLD